jgi:hypothetical protein
MLSISDQAFSFMFWSAPRSPSLVLLRDNSSDKINYAKKEKD